MDIDFNMGTDSGGLSDADLPLAAGDESPEVAERAGEFGFGLRGIDQIFKFGESSAQAVNPSEFGSYETAKGTIEKQLKLDIEKDVFEQLSGDITASASPDGGRSGLKAEVKDPAAFRKTLAAVTRVLPAIAQSSGGARARSASRATCTVGTSSTGTLAYGLVGRDDFVLSDTPAGARAIAAAPTEPRRGCRGRVRHEGRCRPAGHPGARAAGLLGSARRRAGRAAVRRAAGRPDRFGQVQSTEGVGGKITLTFE